MSVDRSALADRLYAERLAAPLRDPFRFCEARLVANKTDVQAYVRRRAEVIRADLSCTAANIQWAIDKVERECDQAEAAMPCRRIVSVVASHARRLMRSAGREMLLRVDRSEPGREILRWRFVSLALPPGILIAAATPGGLLPPAAVRLLDHSIAPDHPVAQHHIHHAAMMSFEELWASLRLRALLRPNELTASLRDTRAFCPGLHSGVCLGGKTDLEKRRASKYLFARIEHMTEWADMIRQAFIARRVLDRHSHHRSPLRDCNDCGAVVRTTLRAFLAGRGKRYSESATSYPWPDELISLARQSRDENTALLLRSSHGRRTDLIRQQTREERNLLVRVFARLRPEELESEDPLYETLFVQYLRVKTAVFGLLVHPPGERGLTKFLEHFLQIKVYAPESDLLLPPVPNEPGLQVRATEYRIAPDAWFKILRLQDAELEAGANRESAHSESAWLIHFKRDRHGEELPLYSSAIRKMESEADQIMRALDAKPVHLKMLCGIDICGVEEAQPLWVSAETLRRVRAHSRAIAAKRPALCLDPLGLTLHCGEDFTWLTSGMRAVAEPFHWKLIERGDRIGHGIAITLDPIGWWDRHDGEVVPVKAFDRLLDLAFLAAYANSRSAGQSEWLRLEIEKIAKTLWPERSDRATLDYTETTKEVWRQLGGRLTRQLSETPRWNGGKRHAEWLYRYLWNRSTQKRAADFIQMKVGDDGNEAQTGSDRNERDLLIMARARLIHEVALWQVCIESSPSSNLVVGSLDAIASQDFLRQRPTHVSAFGYETLTWSISTDDPITFSTTLADEYAYAWAGMVLRENNGYDPSYARALLDEAAATSMRMRFRIPPIDQKRTIVDEQKGKNRARRD